MFQFNALSVHTALQIQFHVQLARQALHALTVDNLNVSRVQRAFFLNQVLLIAYTVQSVSHALMLHLLLVLYRSVIYYRLDVQTVRHQMRVLAHVFHVQLVKHVIQKTARG